MKIFAEMSITQFEAWSGGEDTQNKIIEAGKEDEFDALIEKEYPDGLTEEDLNDLLRYEEDWIFEVLGIEDEEEEEDDD